MRIGYLGDIVGHPGRLAAAHAVKVMREERGVEVVIANAENAANGSGLTPELYKKFKDAGIDGMTLGDHAFKKQQIKHTLETAGDLVRAINWPRGCWGKGAMVVGPGADEGVTPGNQKRPGVHVVMVMGRLFMNAQQADDPFAAVDRYLESIAQVNPQPIVIVEVHAEATSEKVALGWHLNGRVAAVLGTHTHVPTADARVLPKPGAAGTDASIPGSPNPFPGGTAYCTDLGMTGPDDSVLGRRVDRVLKYMTTATPAPFDVAEGRPAAHGVILDIDERSGLSTAVERFDLPLPGSG